MNETGRITHLLLKHARDAFVSAESIARDWRQLQFTAPPDLGRAIGEYDQLVELLSRVDCQIEYLPAAAGVGLDSIYVRDASLVSERGVILCSMGKPARASEPAAHGEALRRTSRPVLGAIQPPGTIEGGDVVWLDSRTVVVGRGYRTNDDGIRQFRALLADSIDTLIVVPLPHWRGPSDVFHLMSMISPIDRDLLLVYSRLLPVPFREQLIDRGYALIDVPDEEFESMGTNVLALAPRLCVMVNGNPLTRGRLEAAGCEVLVYEGTEISHKGGGGPTCLTRPLARASV